MPFPVDSKFVEAAEQKLGVKLPLSYKGRIQPSNGGEIIVDGETWSLFPVLDSSDRRRLNRSCNDICRETKVAKEWPRFPQTAIPFAANGCGDKLIFLPHAEDPGRLGEALYFWSHETGEITKLADDLADIDY